MTTSFWYPLDPELYLTVSDLFDTAQEALDIDAIEVRLEYDPLLDFPTSLYIDVIPDIIDEEVTFLASGLKVVPEPSSLLLGVLATLGLSVGWRRRQRTWATR